MTHCVCSLYIRHVRNSLTHSLALRACMRSAQEKTFREPTISDFGRNRFPEPVGCERLRPPLAPLNRSSPMAMTGWQYTNYSDVRSGTSWGDALGTPESVIDISEGPTAVAVHGASCCNPPRMASCSKRYSSRARRKFGNRVSTPAGKN